MKSAPQSTYPQTFVRNGGRLSIVDLIYFLFHCIGANGLAAESSAR
jgi:hypothetical protein